MLQPGSRAVLKVLHEGRSKKVQISIGEQPGDMGRKGLGSGGRSSFEKYGFSLKELTPQLAEKYNYMKNSGLVVGDVEPGSPAAVAGLRSGQLIEEVNRHKTTSLKELKKALKKSEDDSRILLRVRSGNRSHYIVVVAE